MTEEAAKLLNRKKYLKNRDKIRECSARWKKEHPERARENQRRYYLKHREEILEEKRLERLENIEEFRQKGREAMERKRKVADEWFYALSPERQKAIYTLYSGPRSRKLTPLEWWSKTGHNLKYDIWQEKLSPFVKSLL